MMQVSAVLVVILGVFMFQNGIGLSGLLLPSFSGIPVKWTIQAAAGTINGCNNRLLIPEYQINKKLAIGDNVIEFTPTKSGTVPFSCWMNMLGMNVKVVDDLKQVDLDSIQDEVANTPQLTGGGCCG